MSRIAKRKSNKLCELENQGLLKIDQVLVCSDEGINTEEKYLNLENVIDDFLTYNLKKASAYARFFAALGAISFEFEHNFFNFSKFNGDFSASLAGSAARVGAEIVQSKTVCTSLKSTDALKANMKLNCIPESLGTPDFEDYSEFLAQRRQLIAQKIKAFYFSL